MKYLLFALWALCLAATGAAAQDNYRLKPGDTVTIEVLEDSALNRSLLVLPDGTINFPFAGTVRAGGRTVNQLEASITEGIASNFAATPTVFVTVSTVQTTPEAIPGLSSDIDLMTIYFAGEFQNVGGQQVEPGTTLLQAMALGGGFTDFAATKRIQLRRNIGGGQQRVVILDYRALSRGAAMTNDPLLQDGDVILAPERRLFE